MPMNGDQRVALALADVIKIALRHERWIGDGVVRTHALRLQQLTQRAQIADQFPAMLASVLDEDRRQRENAELVAGRELDGPSGDFLRKRHGPVLLRLWARGRLRDVHLRAAAELREFLEGARTPDYHGSCELQERVDVSLRPSRLEGRMVDTSVERRVKRWRDAMDPTKAEAVLAIVVLEQPLKEIARRYTMRDASVALVLIAALEAYARLAGWSEGAIAVDAAGTIRL